MRRKRYLEKLEFFEDEVNFIASHEVCDDVTEGALLHLMQTCAEMTMDVVVMLTKDAGLLVSDDYANIEKLARESIIDVNEMNVLKEYNGMRNSIVHRYGTLDMERVIDGLDGIDKLYQVVVKLAEIYERVSASNDRSVVEFMIRMHKELS